MDVAAAQVFGSHHLAGGRLHQRRPAQEDGALVPRTMMLSSLMAGT
jgi:hypothetical protein